jgi:hypothetical protein
VCSLLREVIDNDPPPQQTLLKKFLEQTLASIDDMELDKLPSNPTEALKSLLCLSTHQILWDALREVLSKAVDSDVNRPVRRPGTVGRPNSCQDGRDGARTVRPVQACQ